MLKKLHALNPLHWIAENIFKSLMGFMVVAIASGIWMLVLFFWNVPENQKQNAKDHVEFKARLDSLEYWADETDRRFGQVYKTINENKSELYKELWEDK